MLIDIVSKNGNLLLSVPMKGNGTIDDKEEKILEDIAAWMEVNGEGYLTHVPGVFMVKVPPQKQQYLWTEQDSTKARTHPTLLPTSGL